VVEVTTLKVNGAGLLSLTDAAYTLGLPVAVLRMLIADGQLRAVQVGDRQVVTAVDIAEFISSLD
jgi:hypothetical protein